MGRILDDSQALNVAEVVLNAQDDTGFSDEEFIPGLIQAIVIIVERSGSSDQLLDEAANLLADGGI